MALFYDLGEMRSEDGSALRYELEVTASRLAIEISHFIAVHPRYREVEEKTGSAKTLLYFQKVIKDEIYPAVRKLCVLRWYLRNEGALPPGEETVSLAPSPVNMLLARVWPDQTIPLRFKKDVSPGNFLRALNRSLRSWVRRSIDGFWARYFRWKYADFFQRFPLKENMIAVQMAEGVDIERRSDIVWYPKSEIDPERVLLYFSWPDHEPVDENTVAFIETMGMKWVFLNKPSTIIRNAPVWYPPPYHRKKVQDLNLNSADQTEKWIARTGEALLALVDYWSAFYRAFNIRIHCVTGGGELKYIAQSIAFDLHGTKDGFLVGTERSELHWPGVCILGWYPVDIFFTWTPRAGQYLSPNVNQMITSVSTGYPNDIVFRPKRAEAAELKDLLRSRGIDYTIALLDNVHGGNAAHSTANMERFYLAFLDWLLEDPNLGIVIKSKKPSVLQRLPRALPILERAEATGRCIRLGNEFGRLPVDASFASDISVGMGISSAVIEAAIAGCRAIHCDLTHLRSHEFYEWGYERILFDDLDRLLAVMKVHKSNPAANPEFGDWTPFLDRLDPFRDGRAGERMGNYLRWCLTGFDEGMDRNKVILRANEKYRDQWGSDKTLML
jgi:hypothetical protein